MARSKYKRISKRAQDLLSGGEDKNVDYKASVKGVHADDFVAFANSKDGGALLIGVEEKVGPNGLQSGNPIGCSIDDKTRLQIMSKALSCSPAVQIELFIENLEAKPFFRIEIKSGLHKPYATGNGTYKIREDGRNNPIQPEALLKMFAEREGEEFRKRFSEATEGLENRLEAALETVNYLENMVSSKIEEISASMGWAASNADDASYTIDTVKSRVDIILGKQEMILNKQSRICQRVKALIEKTGSSDPVKEQLEAEIVEMLKQKLKNDPSIIKNYKNGKSLTLQLSGYAKEEITEDDFNRLFKQVIDEILELEDES